MKRYGSVVQLRPEKIDEYVQYADVLTLIRECNIRNYWIYLRRLGDAAEASRLTKAKLLHSGACFPTFYRTYYAGGAREFCHLPDTDHAGSAMIAIQ